MAQRDNILQELRELHSSLVNASAVNVYQVPAGYFEALAQRVMQRIEAMEEAAGLFPSLTDMGRVNPYTVPAGYFEHLPTIILERIKNGDLSPVDETSSVLGAISKEMPYKVPLGYFDELTGTILSVVKSDDATAAKELETLSPLLGGLKKSNLYSVPAGYFDSLDTNESKPAGKTQAKVIGMGRKTWFRYAAAAVVTSVIVLSGLVMLNRPASIDPNKNSAEWVKKSMKKVSTDDIEKFTELADEGALAVVTDIPDEMKEARVIKDLIKDIPEADIQKFLDETPSPVADENTDDIFLN